MMRARTAFVSLLLACASCSAEHPRPTATVSSSIAMHPLLGQAMPDFKRTTVGGETIETGSLRGRRVVVKFFAKYCEPCKVTLPAAEHLHRTHDDLAVVGIDIDESVDAASETVRRFGLTFPVIHDSGHVLSGRFRVQDLPMTFLVDRQGRIRAALGTGQTEQELEAAVADLDKP